MNQKIILTFALATLMLSGTAFARFIDEIDDGGGGCWACSFGAWEDDFYSPPEPPAPIVTARDTWWKDFTPALAPPPPVEKPFQPFNNIQTAVQKTVKDLGPSNFGSAPGAAAIGGFASPQLLIVEQQREQQRQREIQLEQQRREQENILQQKVQEEAARQEALRREQERREQEEERRFQQELLQEKQEVARRLAEEREAQRRAEERQRELELQRQLEFERSILAELQRQAEERAARQTQVQLVPLIPPLLPCPPGLAGPLCDDLDATQIPPGSGLDKFKPPVIAEPEIPEPVVEPTCGVAGKPDCYPETTIPKPTPTGPTTCQPNCPVSNPNPCVANPSSCDTRTICEKYPNSAGCKETEPTYCDRYPNDIDCICARTPTDSRCKVSVQPVPECPSGSGVCSANRICDGSLVSGNCCVGRCVAPPDETQQPLPQQPLPPCIQQFLLKNFPNFDLATKTGTFSGREYTWIVKGGDLSAAVCPDDVGYRITDVKLSGSCNSRLTGIYDLKDDPSKQTRKAIPSFGLKKGSSIADLFKVHIRAEGKEACTLSFNIRDPSGNVVDPTFTVNPPSSPPTVNSFEFYGDTESFTTKWEALYFDFPTRSMNVECAVNCDPEATDCSLIPNKACLPYPTTHSTEDVKRGSCTVPTPAYNYVEVNTLKCIFYDPAVGKDVVTTISQTFKPFDYSVKSPDRITSVVGKPVQLKVDVANKGLIQDNYVLTLSAASPQSLDVLKSNVTTQSVSSKSTTSAFSAVMPLTDEDNALTIVIKSVNCPTCTPITLNIPVRSGTFSLPEFGVVGFMQILILAAVLYFLFSNRLLMKGRKK